MTHGNRKQARILSRKHRLILGSVLILIIVLLVLGAASIPFFFESASIKYKLGLDKTFLRVGKVLGMIAGFILLLQMLMAARFKILDRIFSLNGLLSIHRVNAVTIAVLTLLHPLFVFAPEDIGAIQLNIDSWPEILGGTLLLLIWFLLSTGIWRQFLDLSFKRWWLIHRFGTLALIGLLFVHVLFVSDTFRAGLPRLIIFVFIVLYAFVFASAKLRRFLTQQASFTVSRVFKAGKDAYGVTLEKRKGNVPDYFPGQFAFLKFISKHISAEEHPFTISSTPTRPLNLQFTIRCSGDWTGGISRLRSGDRAVIEGPYGLFSHLARPWYREWIMIAGGIGITPMLSMLRYMTDQNEKRPVTLIWSNRTSEDVVYLPEFEAFQKSLIAFRLFHVFTRDPDARLKRNRLEKSSLERMLRNCSRQSGIFLCGPPKMMHDIRHALIELGFPRSAIHTENFRL